MSLIPVRIADFHDAFEFERFEKRHRLGLDFIPTVFDDSDDELQDTESTYQEETPERHV